MRNPNGYGGISFLGGNRRRPFRVRVTTGWEYDEDTDRQKQKYAVLGYYATRKEALIALAEYNKSPYDLTAGSVTFKEIFNLWSKSADGYGSMSTSSVNSYRTAYKKCEPLYEMKVADIRRKHLQAVIDEYADFSSGTQGQIAKVMRAVFKYCIDNEILQINPTLTLRINGNNDDKENIHTPYTSEEIAMLWENLNTPVSFKYSAKDIRDIYPTDTILMMIYTGMRPSELLQMKCENIHLEARYMVGGLKTGAGKNRVIPIHRDIEPLIRARMEAGGKYLIPYKSDDPPKLGQYRTYIFDPLAQALSLTHLPHDGRHTFATFADRSGANETAIARIMGHSLRGVTKQVYTHKDIADLIEAIDMITFEK